MQENEHSGVQGVLTLSFDSRENAEKKEETTYASQLSAGDENTVVLVEYSNKKGLMDNTSENSSSAKYSINADTLVSLIKEHGQRVK